MLVEQIFSVAGCKLIYEGEAAPHQDADTEQRDRVSSAFRRTKNVRSIALADLRDFTARIEQEMSRYRTLSAHFERSADPAARRRLQASLQHLHRLKFAMRNAAATVDAADRQIEHLRRAGASSGFIGDRAA